MIYTVTLNPSIDYAVHLARLVPGITNRTSGEEVSFGGKGINVSFVLAELGLKSTALGLIAGFTGDAIAQNVGGDRLRADFIRLRSGLSRINVKIKAGVETEINGQGPRVEPDELEALMNKLDAVSDGDTLILSGSVPGALPDDVYERILIRLNGRAVRVVVDASGRLLISCLPFRPFLVKPNRQELSELFCTEIENDADVGRYARRLQEMGARNVLVSLGKEGALLADETGRMHRVGAVPGKAVNTVGAGDSMVAGFVAGWEQRGDYAFALRLGIVCGSATAFSPGLADRRKIDELLRQTGARL